MESGGKWGGSPQKVGVGETTVFMGEWQHTLDSKVVSLSQPNLGAAWRAICCYRGLDHVYSYIPRMGHWKRSWSYSLSGDARRFVRFLSGATEANSISRAGSTCLATCGICSLDKDVVVIGVPIELKSGPVIPDSLR